MRIVLLSGTYLPQSLLGVSRFVQQLKIQLQFEHKVTHLTTFQAARQTTESDVVGVVNDWRIHHLWSLVRSILAHQPEVIHIQYAPAEYNYLRSIGYLPLLLRLAGAEMPIVTTLHEYGNHEWLPAVVPLSSMRRFHRWAEQQKIWDRETAFLLSFSDVIVSPNDATTRLILSRFPQYESRLRQSWLAPPIELSPANRVTVRRRLQLDHNWPDNALIASYFGPINPQAGLLSLIKAFAQAKTLQPRLRLLLLGHSPETTSRGQKINTFQRKLQSEIKARKLSESVVICQASTPALISNYLLASDFGVYTPDSGTTLRNTAIMSLLQHRLPLIMTRHRPPEVQLERQPFTFVISPQQSEQLRSMLLILSRSSFMRQRLGRFAAEYAQQFSWERVRRQHHQLYQEMSRQTPSRFTNPVQTPSLSST